MFQGSHTDDQNDILTTIFPSFSQAILLPFLSNLPAYYSNSSRKTTILSLISSFLSLRLLCPRNGRSHELKGWYKVSEWHYLRSKFIPGWADQVESLSLGGQLIIFRSTTSQNVSRAIFYKLILFSKILGEKSIIINLIKIGQGRCLDYPWTS